MTTDTEKTADQTEAMQELAQREAQTAKQGRATTPSPTTTPSPASHSPTTSPSSTDAGDAGPEPRIGAGHMLLELEVGPTTTSGELFDSLLEALARDAGSSLPDLQDRKKTSDGVRLQVEERVSACARLARNFTQRSGKGVLRILAVDKGEGAGGLAVRCDGPTGRTGTVLLPPLAKPAAAPATSSTPSPTNPPQNPPAPAPKASPSTAAPELAPPALGLARPGLARRGAPRGPIR